MMTQREFFNSMAEEWDIICQHDANKIKRIIDILKIKSGDKILDAGTGTGILLPFLFEKIKEEGEIIAVDVSEKMLEVAQRKYHYNNVSFVHSDVLNANLQSNYFDLVICYSVFPHFEDKQQAISMIRKYLRKGGKFAICHSQSREAINNIHKNACEVVSEDNLPDMDTIKIYFESKGMEVVLSVDNDEMFVVVAQK